jgi:hypothetical protein
MAERTVVNSKDISPHPEPHRLSVIHAGLPLSEFATGERRLEGERYLLGGYALRRKMKSVPCATLMELADVWQPGRLKGITVSSEDGVPFFTATQVFDIRPAARKWLAPSRTYDLEKRYVEPGWILVTCSGAVGDAIISYGPLAGVIISHDLLRVQVRNPAHLGYIYGFLRSRFARSMLFSDKYGSIVKHLEPEHLQELLVPLVGEDIHEPLTGRVKTVYSLRDEAFHLSLGAEAMYTAQLGVELAGFPQEPGFSVPASALFERRRRLDGFHYNPRAQRALEILNAGGMRVAPLSTLGYAVLGVSRFKHLYSADGIPYLVYRFTKQ